jgi:hypothetical protein
LLDRVAGPVLVVPTPTIPQLSQAPSEVWDELTLLTQSVGGRRPDDFDFGCDGTSFDAVRAPGAPGEDGVTIHGQETVGQFLATILSSDDPDALVDWLADNGFAIEAEDAARFTSYVEREWFFTAMKPDTTVPGNRMPPGGWDADVDPVAFTFAAEVLELPLPVLTINSASRLPLSFYVIDDHRMDFPLFDTIYANRVNASEFEAIARRHPALATLLSPGRFLTRLDRTVITSPQPVDSIFLERAPTDEEFRRTGSSGFFPVPLFIVGAFMIMTRRRALRVTPAD